MKLAKNSAVGVFANMTQAEDAVRQLNAGGFPVDKLSVLGKDFMSEQKVHGFVTACDVAKQAAGTSAWFGGIFGLLVGAAFLWIPGFGPMVVAGPLAAALLGGVEGAVGAAAVGGVLGWLMNLGIEKQHIPKYEASLRTGKYIVIVHGSSEDVDKARSILSAAKAEQVDVHKSAA